MKKNTAQVEVLKANFLSFLAKFNVKKSFANTILKKLAVQGKGHTQREGAVEWYDEYFDETSSSNPYGNSLPIYLVNKLAEAHENNQSDQLNQIRQDIIDMFFMLSHLYAISQATANQQLAMSIKQAFQRLLVKYPLKVINILNLADKKQQVELSDLMGSSRNIISLLSVSLSSQAIYDAANKDNLVDNFYHEFNQQVEQFKKHGKGRLTQQHIICLTIQINHLLQIKNSLPDGTAYQYAKVRLNALINSCVRAIPEVWQHLKIDLPDISTISVNLDWAGIAGTERKFAQPYILKPYEDEIKHLQAEYVALLNRTVNSLVNSSAEDNQSLQSINKQITQHQMALLKVQNSPDWFQAYAEQFEQSNRVLLKLKAIEQTCQKEYNNLLGRQKILEKSYDAEVGKVNDYQNSFFDLLPEEKNKLENTRKELKNIRELSLQKIKTRQQEVQGVINEIQKNINALPDIEIFKQNVISKIEATMVSLAGSGGEKDQILGKLGGEIFNLKIDLLEKLEILSKQSMPKSIQQIDAIVLKNQVKNINDNLSQLQGTGFDETLRKQSQDLSNAIEKNNTILAQIINSMNELAAKIAHAKLRDIPVGELNNTKPIKLDAFKKLLTPGSPQPNKLESSQNIEQLNEHSVQYKKASVLINARNEEIAQLQHDYKSFDEQYQKLKKNNSELFTKLQGIESDLQDKASSVALLNSKSIEVRKNLIAEETFISRMLNQLNAPKDEARQSLIALVNNKNKFVASVKSDKSLIVNADGKSISDLPESMEKDAIKSLNFLENRSEKIVEFNIRQAEIYIDRSKKLQNSMDQKQKERSEKLNKIPATFRQYCVENGDKTFNECIVNYETQLDEVANEFHQGKINQRKEKREQAITQLKSNFTTLDTNNKQAVDDINRLNDNKKQLIGKLQEQSRALDKSTKKASTSILGSVSGIVTGAIIAFIVTGFNPLAAIIGGIIGAAGGYAAGRVIPTKLPSDSFANIAESSFLSKQTTTDEDNSAEFDINNLFSGTRIAPLNQEDATQVNYKEGKDELSNVKTLEDFDNFIFDENVESRKESTITNSSNVSGAFFHRPTQPENTSPSNDPIKNRLR